MSDYITVDELKATLAASGVSFLDADAQAAISAAEKTIDKLCNRRFTLDTDAAQVRYYQPARRDILEIDDLVVCTSVQSDDDGTLTYPNLWVLNTDFFLEPTNAAADGEPWTQIRVGPLASFAFSMWPRSVKVTGQFGWSAVPDAVVEATTILAGRMLQTARTPSGVMVFADQAMRIARLDSTILGLIGPYRRHRVAVG